MSLEHLYPEGHVLQAASVAVATEGTHQHR